MTAIINTLCMAIGLYSWVLFIFILLSWFPHETGIIGKVYDALEIICEPFLKIFRKFIPPVGNGGMAVDFSPLAGFFALQILEILLKKLFL